MGEPRLAGVRNRVMAPFTPRYFAWRESRWVLFSRCGSVDAGRSDVWPCLWDGVQAGLPGHGGRLPPPAGREFKLCLPERMLALVVDDDGKGIPWCLTWITHNSTGAVSLRNVPYCPEEENA